MSLDLTSTRAKLGHARVLAKTVEDEIVAWHDRKPYSVSYETNADSTRYSIVIHFNKSIPDAPIQRWSLMIADSIHNFRCALDHLVYAVAVAELAQDPPPHADKLMLPICDGRASFNRDVKRWKLGAISAPMQAVFELFQPYNRPYPKLPPFLAMLRDFENSDKHKLLRLIYTAVSNADIGFTGPPIASGTRGVVFLAAKGEIKDGTEIATFAFNRPQPNMKFDRSNFTIVFALAHKTVSDGISDRDDATTLLMLIGDEVETVIESVSKNFV